MVIYLFFIFIKLDIKNKKVGKTNKQQTNKKTKKKKTKI